MAKTKKAGKVKTTPQEDVVGRALSMEFRLQNGTYWIVDPQN